MRYSKEEKTMWLDDWRQSGKSAWSYAKSNGINHQTFINWRKAEDETQSCLVEVPARIMPAVHSGQEILIEKGEIKIHIPLTLGYKELGAIFGFLG